MNIDAVIARLSETAGWPHDTFTDLVKMYPKDLIESKSVRRRGHYVATMSTIQADKVVLKKWPTWNVFAFSLDPKKHLPSDVLALTKLLRTGCTRLGLTEVKTPDSMSTDTFIIGRTPHGLQLAVA